MLEAADADASKVVDLYAGTGALGIEALSRGAGSCTFVEADARVCEVLRENLERTQLAERAEVVGARVGRWRAPADGTYTLAFADPPYDDSSAWDAVAQSLAGALAEHAFVVVEHAARSAPRAELLGRALWRDRRQGEGAVAVYRRDEQTREGRA